jgi:hypothetical protein
MELLKDLSDAARVRGRNKCDSQSRNGDQQGNRPFQRQRVVHRIDWVVIEPWDNEWIF